MSNEKRVLILFAEYERDARESFKLVRCRAVSKDQNKCFG